jgi:hypothetical protein
MADVSVNIRGRDDGLGASLDSLREKAQALGKDVSNINQSNMSRMTPTEQRLAVEHTSKETLRAKQDDIRSEFSSARKANIDEFGQAESRFSQGKMSAADFASEKKKFSESQETLGKEENQELINVEKEMNQHLRIIVREMVMQKRLEREIAQRDDKEHSLREKEDKEREENKDENGVTVVGARPLAIDKEKEDSDNDNDRNKKGQLVHAIDRTPEMASGTLRPLVKGGIDLMSGIVSLAASNILTAGVAAGALITYKLAEKGNEIAEAAGNVGAFRGMGHTGSDTMRGYTEDASLSEESRGIGIDKAQLLNLMADKARASGHADNLKIRTLNDQYIQKSTGADPGVYSKFERFNTNQETSNVIAMDMLNTLARIDGSSLKEGDLATLQEKMGIQTNLMDIQRSKRDAVDVDDTLRIMSAFESIGLSQKGEKGGEFLANTITGLGEGGSDNAMLLKYEAMKRAHPEAANDPAELRRLVKFHSDDPEYMKEAFGFFGQITNNNDMARDDLMYSMFNPQSEHDMTMWGSAMEGKGSFNQLLTGAPNKQWRGSLSGEQIMADAQTTTGSLTDMEQYVKQIVEGFGVSVNGLLEDITGNGGKSVNVNLKGNLATPTHNVNKTKTGGK